MLLKPCCRNSPFIADFKIRGFEPSIVSVWVCAGARRRQIISQPVEAQALSLNTANVSLRQLPKKMDPSGSSCSKKDFTDPSSLISNITRNPNTVLK